MALSLKLRVPLFFLFFILLLNNYPSHAIQPSFIKGTILNTYNNSLITSATISTTTGLSTIASSGTFLLRVPPNVYDVIVSAPGFCSNLLTGILAAPGQTAAVNIRLSPSSTETGFLEGRVIELGTMEGINRALITTDLGGVTTSNENGYFRMITPSGFATVTVAAEGVTSKIMENISIPPYRKKHITVYVKKSPSGTVSVSGIIRDACMGTKIGNVRVVSSTGEIALSSNGYYSINTVPGPTTFLLSAVGYQFSYQTFSLYTVPKSNKINFKMIPSENGFGLIQGVIINSYTQEPLENVKFETDTGTISFSKDDGSFLIYTNLCTSSLVAYKDGFISLEIPVSIPYGSPSILNLTLDPLGIVSGVVSDSNDSHKIRGAKVSLYEQTDISDISAEDGSYLLYNIFPGQYTISVSHRCYLPEHLTVSVASDQNPEENFSLTPQANGMIQGFVSDIITGAPLSSARIIADHGSETTTDETGFYSITLPACKNYITFDADGYLSQTKRNIFIKENEILDINTDLIPCPVSISIEDSYAVNTADIILDLIRIYRDDVLTGNVILREHTRAFYHNALEISKILYKNDKLRELSRNILFVTFQILKNNSSRKNLTVDEEFTEDVLCFFEKFNQEPLTSDLRRDINRLLSDLRKGVIFEALGITVY